MRYDEHDRYDFSDELDCDDLGCYYDEYDHDDIEQDDLAEWQDYYHNVVDEIDE
jgi:hypothetical protein